MSTDAKKILLAMFLAAVSCLIVPGLRDDAAYLDGTDFGRDMNPGGFPF